MNHLRHSIFALLAALFLSGCGSLMAPPPSGVAPAALYADVNYPSRREAKTKLTFSRKDIDILGPVSTSGESYTVLYLVALGDNGYNNLLKAARQKYPGADGVMNLQWDTRYTHCCFPSYVPIIIYSKAAFTAEATAFRFKR